MKFFSISYKIFRPKPGPHGPKHNKYGPAGRPGLSSIRDQKDNILGLNFENTFSLDLSNLKLSKIFPILELPLPNSSNVISCEV